MRITINPVPRLPAKQPFGLIQNQDYVDGFEVIIESHSHTNCISFARFERQLLFLRATAFLPCPARGYIFVRRDFIHNPGAMPNIDLDPRGVGDGRLSRHSDQGFAASPAINAELSLDGRLPHSEQIELNNRQHKTYRRSPQEKGEIPTDCWLARFPVFLKSTRSCFYPTRLPSAVSSGTPNDDSGVVHTQAFQSATGRPLRRPGHRNRHVRGLRPRKRRRLGPDRRGRLYLNVPA